MPLLPRQLVDNRNRWTVIAAVALCLLLAKGVFAWGSAGHRLMTADVAARLPDALQPFYQAHLPQLADASVAPIEAWPNDAKLRRRSQWFYVDLDAASNDDGSEITRETRLAAAANFPRDERQIKRVYRRHNVSRGGRLPWAVADQYAELVDAFRSGDSEKLTEATGLLIHFAAETSFPLAVTVDRRGERAGNPTYDNFREYEPAFAHRDISSRIGDEYIRRARAELLNELAAARSEAGSSNADFVGDVLERSFEQCMASLGETDEWLALDRTICTTAGINSAESMVERAQEYYLTLDDQFQGHVAARLSAGSRFAAVLIERAWREAGQPDLGSFTVTAPPEQLADMGREKNDGLPPANPDYHRIVASRMSKVFHRASCPFAQKISPDNLVALQSVEAAEATGRRWCRMCGPSKENQSMPKSE